jgi:hypothetical protein
MGADRAGDRGAIGLRPRAARIKGAGSMPLPDPLAYYCPEVSLFPGLARHFADTGELHEADST